MKLYKRQDAILRMVKSRGACSIVELAEMLEVSDETIRRNIRPLIEKNLLDKVHGGVVLPENADHEQPFMRRMMSNAAAKETIAELTAGLIADGDSLMMDTGSTTAITARFLRGHKALTVVTNCTEIARILATQPENRVYMAGGELRLDDPAIFGTSAITFVRQFNVKYAILSIAAISLQGEFMDHHMVQAEFSRAIIGQAQKTIVVADHTKFNTRTFVKVCSLQDVDILVCDQPPPDALLARLEQSDVKIVLPDAQARNQV